MTQNMILALGAIYGDISERLTPTINKPASQVHTVAPFSNVQIVHCKNEYVLSNQ